ncbi:MAG: hypothetical protein ACYTFI_12880 [Planctomycetota bacterium]
MALLLTTCLVTGPAEAASLSYESGGLVVVEVESVPPAGRWEKETELEGFTGSCYYGDGGGGGELVYKIVITDGGRYNMRIRNRHEHPDHTLGNDCWTKMDDGPRIKTYSSKRGQWTWHTRHEPARGAHRDPVYELAPGAHTFVISGRSKGFLDATRKASAGGPMVPELVELERVAAHWRAGMLGPALARAETKIRSTKPAEAEEARRAVETLTAYAKEQRDRIEALKATAPEAAVELLVDLGRRFSPSKTGRDLLAEARRWNQEPAVKNACRARGILERIKGPAKRLRGKDVSADAKLARRYAAEIRFIASGVKLLKKDYPDTPACEEASRLAKRLGISAASEGNKR